MSQFTMQLANTLIEVQVLFSSTKTFCKEYLWEEQDAPEGLSAAQPLSVVVALEDIAYERQKSFEEDAAMGVPTRTFAEEYLETLAVYRTICDAMPQRDTFLFHCSAVAVDGKAFLFSAPSGTGKSTHVRLWREMFGNRAVMVNDDKPLLKVTAEGTFVYGTPWDGKHRLSTNMSAPVQGICLLEQSAENKITPIEKTDAFPKLLQQTYRPQNSEALIKTMELLDRVASTVPLYRLQCNMEPAAARVAYEGMCRDKKGETP